jgi:integrase
VSGRARTAPSRPSERWAPPLDPTAYDRSPGLSVAEQRALAEGVARGERGGGGWPPAALAALRRLLTPVDDVLAYVGTPSEARAGVRLDLLRATHAAGYSFWGWERDRWLAALARPHTCQHAMAVAYLLCGVHDLHLHRPFMKEQEFAAKVFGADAVPAAADRVGAELQRWGYSGRKLGELLPRALARLLLLNGSPHLEDISPETLRRLEQKPLAGSGHHIGSLLGRALASLGIVNVPAPTTPRQSRPATYAGISPGWTGWCERWAATSTTEPKTRRSVFYELLKVGRWLAKHHPAIQSPEDWTRELAAEYVAAVDRMTVGELAPATARAGGAKIGKPLAPATKAGHLMALRALFRDCHEWNWTTTRRFDPSRALAAPNAVRAKLRADPRVIADDAWAKLLWAGLNLSDDDLPRRGAAHPAGRCPIYPLALVRAVVVTWLFAGLRSDEIRRLPVGCVRWQRGGAPLVGGDRLRPEQAVCLLAVPTNKTSAAFTKPVDRVVGEAVEAWERARPDQPAMLDRKTGEAVRFLFCYRGKQIGKQYFNAVLVPLLCRKAGVPVSDARGAITSHRARSTIASQLANAKDPMSLLELQEWLGHRTPQSTLHYVKTAPTRLAKAYADAGYFGRNVRAVEVLIDQDAVKSGAAAQGEPWRFYDLGHGYCTYDFFDQCPHRMACAKCAFYRPKGSSQAQLLEAKANLLRLKQEIPLTDDERAAVDDGLEALDKLCGQLADVPTPAGPTPRELGATRHHELPVLQEPPVAPTLAPNPYST